MLPQWKKKKVRDKPGAAAIWVAWSHRLSRPQSPKGTDKALHRAYSSSVKIVLRILYTSSVFTSFLTPSPHPTPPKPYPLSDS